MTISTNFYFNSSQNEICKNIHRLSQRIFLLRIHISQFKIYVFFLISLVVILLLLFIETKDDDELAEKMNEVKEKFNTVPYVIIVTTDMLLNDELCVEQYEGSEDGSTGVKAQVEEGSGSEEHVHQRCDEKNG